MRYFIHFAYNGRPYHGWQRQPNAHSVQAELENAFSNDNEPDECQYKIGIYTFIGEPKLSPPVQTNTRNNNDYEIRRIPVVSKQLS